jgi:hypothetical protein
MLKKRILIIISAIFISLAIVLYFAFQKKPSENIIAPEQQDETSPSPSADQYPMDVPVVSSDEDIQKAFTDFASKEQAGPLEWLKFSDSKKQPISLDEFANAVGIKIKPQLKILLDSGSYELFICNDGDMTNHGIVMNIRLIPDYQGNLYRDEVRFMRAWESSLFRDTSKIIFPNANFTQDQLKQPITFKDGDYRYANVVLPDNTAGTVNYNLVDDYVIISSSKDCLKKASEYVFSTSS